jgi:hypothetical protein
MIKERIQEPGGIRVKNSIPEHDWSAFRTFLKDLLQDATAKRFIEQRTDISSRTLARWISGETEEPDRKRLISLLHALPQYRDSLLAVITRAVPDFDVPLIDHAGTLAEELPMDFWVRLLETNANTPRNLHFTAVVNLIFLQIQSFVDPERIGVQLIVAHCTPPASPDLPVRSLREIMKMTTHQPLFKSASQPRFLGAESLSGYSVSLCQANVVQNVLEERRLPVRKIPGGHSAAVYPIQRGGHVAGCFIVSSPQPDFFSQWLQYVLQVYAYLLSMAFETPMFYPPERIRLRPMPEEDIQRRFIAQFQDRVIRLLQQNTSLSRPQAETLAWQQIEEDLLTFPSSGMRAPDATEGDPHHADPH